MIMIDYTTLVSAKLNLSYDKQLFTEEYDKHILPISTPVLNGPKKVIATAKTNIEWSMVPPEIYAQGQVRSATGEKSLKTAYPSWTGCSLLYLDTEDETLHRCSKNGSVAIRNHALDQMGEWKFYKEFDNLEITKFIKKLPLTNLIGIRCVSLQENTFAIIHRDDTHFLTTKQEFLETQTMVNNHIWNSGFVQITINLSDGGAPLYYGLTESLDMQHKTINDDIYLFNDYAYHGVSLTNSRRRQIRVTGRPTPELSKFIEESSAVTFIN
jgi:hypothetical protein